MWIGIREVERWILSVGECNWEWGGTVQSVDQSEARGHRHGGYSRYHWHSGTVTTTRKPLLFPSSHCIFLGSVLARLLLVHLLLYNPTATRNFLTQPTFNACLPTIKWLQEWLNQRISIMDQNKLTLPLLQIYYSLLQHLYITLFFKMKITRGYW